MSDARVSPRVLSRVSNVSTRTFGFRSLDPRGCGFELRQAPLMCRAGSGAAGWSCRPRRSPRCRAYRPRPRRVYSAAGDPSPPRPDQEHACRFELLLSLDPHIGKDEVPRVAQDLFVRQLGQRVRHRRASRNTGDDGHRVTRLQRRPRAARAAGCPGRSRRRSQNCANRPSVAKRCGFRAACSPVSRSSSSPTLPPSNSTASRPPTNGRSGVGMRIVTAIRPSVLRW